MVLVIDGKVVKVRQEGVGVVLQIGRGSAVTFSAIEASAFVGGFAEALKAVYNKYI